MDLLDDDSDNFDLLRKKVKASLGNSFVREVKCVAELQKLNPSEIEVLEPDEREIVYETIPSEEVPTGVEAESDGYWFMRIRTELPEEFHRRATVQVSINRTE